MVVIGIDFGSESCVVSSMQNQKFTTLSNDYNKRKTPSFVSFDDQKREIGVAAKNQQLTNFDNTIHNFKKLLMVPKVKKIDYQSFQLKHGQFEFPVNYLNGSEKIDCIQITAMLFAKLKADAVAALKPDEVTECVIAIPAYFTKSEFKSVLIAAAVGGLECNRIIKETTAVAVNYRYNRKIPDKAFIAFVDFGYESFQVSIWQFGEEKMEAIAEVAEMIGGRKIDELLADYFIDQIGVKHPFANKKNKGFCVGLLAEVEKLKTKMTVNTEELPLDIKHLLNDESTKLSMSRSEMESICQSVFDRIEALMQNCLEQSKLSPEDIHSVEIVGGSSRMPSVKYLIKKVFGKVPTATMNQDEAVSRGCFLKSVMSKKMKDFQIIEIPLQEGEAEKKGFMKIGEIHSVFRGDKSEQLSINRSDFEGRLKMEKLMANYDKIEINRRNAWNELDEYVNKESKQGGMLVNIQDTSLRTQVSDIKTWRNGTKDEYCEKLKILTSYVDETREEIRITALDKFATLINENMKYRGMLSDPKLAAEMKSLLNWKNGSAEEYNSAFVKWTNYIEKEKERCAARKLVLDLIARETTINGMLNGYIDKTELMIARNCNDGTTEYYTEQFDKLSQYVEQERKRCQARTDLHTFINAGTKTGGLLNRQDWKETMDKIMKWDNGSAEEYTEALDSWKLNSKKENDRRYGMDKLHNFINDQMKPGRMLDDRTLISELNKDRNSRYLTIEECEAKLNYWQKYADDIYEGRREIARLSLRGFIAANYVRGGLLDNQNLVEELDDILTWDDKSLEQYKTTLRRLDKLASDEKKRRKAYDELNDYIGDNWQILEELKLVGAYQNNDIAKDETTEFFEQELHTLVTAVEMENARTKAEADLLQFVNNLSLPGEILCGEKFRKEKEEIVSWTQEHRTIEEYKAEKLKWVSRADAEKERCSERKKLLNFIAQNLKAGGVLDELRFADDVEKIYKLLDEPTEFYKNEIEKWIVILQEEKHRKFERQKLYDLLDAHNEIGGILTDSKFQEEMLQIRNSCDESVGRYENESQKWNEIIKTEQKLRDQAHKKLLEFYDQEMKSGGALNLVRDELKFTKQGDQASVEEFSSELEKWKLYAKSQREASRLDAETKLHSFIDSLHKGCLYPYQRKELNSSRDMPNRSRKEYTDKLEDLKRTYVNKCMKRDFFSTEDVERWQPRLSNLITLLGSTPNDELRKILENTESLLTFQVPACRYGQDERKKANKNIDDLLKNAENILEPSFLFSATNILWDPWKSVKQNFEKLEKLINSIRNKIK